MNKKINLIPYYCLLLLTIILIMIGYKYDLQIAEKLYIGRDNGFCTFIASIGISLPFMIFPLFGGFLFIEGKKRKNKLVRFLTIHYGMGISAVSWLVASDEFVGSNGYNIEHNRWIVYIIALLISALLFYIGMKQAKKNENDQVWMFVAFTFIVLLLSSGIMVKGMKVLYARPRYRDMVDGVLNLDLYHKLFEKFKDYESYMTMYNASKEAFKSFPSGHACAACSMIVILTYLPLVFPKLEKYRPYLFITGLVFLIIVCITRLLIGAHFLSDIGFGILLSLLNIIIYDIFRNKYLTK